MKMHSRHIDIEEVNQMYAERIVARASRKLLRKSVTDIVRNRADTTKVLLRLRAFVDVLFNDSGRGEKLITLILADMWSMFNKELRK